MVTPMMGIQPRQTAMCSAAGASERGAGGEGGRARARARGAPLTDSDGAGADGDPGRDDAERPAAPQLLADDGEDVVARGRGQVPARAAVPEADPAPP